MTRTIISTTDLMEANWPFLRPQMGGADYDWQTHTAKAQKDIAGLSASIRIRCFQACMNAARAAKQAKHPILVSHLPNMAALTNLARKALAPRVPQIAFAFNFTDLPAGLRRNADRYGLRGIDEFVVFSRYEQQLYAESLGLPPERLRFMHWAMDPPTPGPAFDGLPDGPYVCAIGGEARDYALLAEAMRRLPHRQAVIVARPYSVAGIELPPNVQLHINLPSEKTWRLAAESQGMILPLRSRQATCGHITFVAAQLLGIPLVATDCLGLADYLSAETVFRAVPPQDLDALTTATEDLFSDPDAAQAVAQAARTAGRTTYALGNWVTYLEDAISRLQTS